MYKKKGKFDIRKFFFTHCIVDVWNSLPNKVVTAPSVNLFKNRLDRHWKEQDLVYDFEAQLNLITPHSDATGRADESDDDLNIEVN